MRHRFRPIYEAFMQHAQLLSGSELVVGLAFQSFCDPCHSTKPHIEALALQHGFALLEVDLGADLSPEFAGTLLPLLIVFRNGLAVGEPLAGAHRKTVILDYLRRYGAIKFDGGKA